MPNRYVSKGGYVGVPTGDGFPPTQNVKEGVDTEEGMEALILDERYRKSRKKELTRQLFDENETEAEAEELAKAVAQVKAIGTVDKGSFKELMECYEMTHREWDPYEREYVGEESTKTVLMDSTVDAFYHKTNSNGRAIEKISLNELPIKDTHPEDNMSLTTIDPEVYHGITLRQIRGLWANVKRRCIEEKWTSEWTKKLLSPETVNLHDVKKYVVKPLTEHTRESFVASLPSTAAYQVPRVYISAPFTLPIRELVVCLEAFVHNFRTNFTEEHDEKGGGMTPDTPVWLVGFARNQWPEKPYPEDPMQTPMANAIKVTKGRVLSITDKDGTNFTRAWPALESSLAIKNRLWYIYTAHDNAHNGAVGLISGGATCDVYPMDTLNREKSFPTQLIVKCIKHDVKHVTAQEASDRKNILNLIAEASEPDDKYASYNDAFRAHFTTPGTLQAALLLNDGSWQSMLKVMSKGHMSTMQFDFDDGKGWDKMTDDNAVELIKHLPHSIKILKIRCGNFSSRFIRALGDWIATSKLTHLTLEDTLVNSFVDDDSIRYFAKALKKGNKSLVMLKVWRVNRENEQKVWEEDVDIIEILAQNEEIAKALFAPLDTLYNETDPNFAKITFLHTLFMRLNRSFPEHVDNKQSKKTLDWVQGLSAPARAALFQSKAGAYVKTILNRKFTWRQNIAVVIFDLYIQIAIVVLLSYVIGKNDLDDGYNPSSDLNDIAQNILTACWVWISIRELMQIGGTYAKLYIKEPSNWFDVIQIVLLYLMMTASLDDNNEIINQVHVFAIMASWVTLIYDLSHLNFQLAIFVTGVVRIIKQLIPFLCAAGLLTLMFAHAFRAKFVGIVYDKCEDTNSSNTAFGDGWNTCNTLVESYTKAFAMFLTDGGWEFNGPGKTLMFVYAFFMGLILLNMIIAIVSNIFTSVQDDAKTAFWDDRLAITTEIESLWRHLFPCLQHSLRTQFLAIEDVRFNFSVEASRKEEVDADSDNFFNWWFAPMAREFSRPSLFKRLQAFYSYSVWEDIIYPGVVLERVLLGLKHDAGFEDVKHEQKLSKLFQWNLARGMVITILWFLFIIHVVIMVTVFICGMVPLGLFWPHQMKQYLFHESTEPNVSEIKELRSDNDKLKEDLRKDYYKLSRGIEEIKTTRRNYGKE